MEKKTDREIRVGNMTTHLNTIQKEMEVVQLKFLDTSSLAANTITHEVKKYMDLQNASQFIMTMKEAVFPEPKPQIVLPEKKNMLHRLIN